MAAFLRHTHIQTERESERKREQEAVNMQQVAPANDATVNTHAASVPLGSYVCVRVSAGCGRTGVICALDYIHDLLVTKVTHNNTSHVRKNHV